MHTGAVAGFSFGSGQPGEGVHAHCPLPTAQGTTKTENSSDLAHYFYGRGPNYKKNVRRGDPDSSWRALVRPVGS